MRATPLSDMLINNLDCFTPEQLEKIFNTEPRRTHAKARFGVMVDTDTNDYAQSGFEFFKFK
ncbi:hypothetical protein LCGC14_0619220 [marine sediment metagenome]|uniref:Uncharacterized protein n=1 Tax=marine sediment metagenome TaxID=412755 RepID=A0A0F9R575_9ZZZZ